MPARHGGTREQCASFLQAIEHQRLAALFKLAAYYGLRRGELVGLRWADVDLASRKIHVRGDVKSEDSDRVITIGAYMVEVLLTWQGQRMMERLDWGDTWTDSGHVFTREDGRPVRPLWVTERFRRLTAEASLPPVRLHDLRHGAATMLLAAGGDIKVISKHPRARHVGVHRGRLYLSRRRAARIGGGGNRGLPAEPSQRSASAGRRS